MDNKANKLLNLLERKFDLGSGTLGNGTTIWNRAREVHGDYEKIAHVSDKGEITWYIKKPPPEVVEYVEDIAKDPAWMYKK